MANIVAGFGVPHTPVFPFFVKRDGPESETAKLFAAQKEQLAAVRPDVIVRPRCCRATSCCDAGCASS